MSEYEASLRDHERTIDELRSTVLKAKMDASTLLSDLEKMTAERDLLRGDIERLEQEFVILEDDRDRWRKDCLKNTEVLRSKGKDND